MGLNRGMEYGFISQQVEEVLPEITRVKTFDTQACVEMKPGQQLENNSEEFVVMDYTRIIPILTKAIQEQQEMIEALQKKVEALEQASSAPQKVFPMKSSNAGSDMCFSGSGSLNFNMSFDLGSTPVEFSIDKDSGMTISMEHVEFCITEDSCVVKMPGGVTFNVPMSSNAGKKAA